MKKFKSNIERAFYAQHKLPYEVTRFPYVITHHYTPDFQVSPTAFVETKGLFTGADRTKMLEVKKQHPELTFLMAFQNPNLKLSKASKTTYAMWCEKHSIQWCKWDDVKTVTSFIAKYK